MSVADNIKKLRNIFNITQKELSEIAGVTENAVSKWENGYSEPRMGAIERMAACYGISKMNIIEDGGMDLIDPVTKKQIENIPPNAIPIKKTTKSYLPLLGRVHAGDAQEPDVIDSKIPVPYEVWENHKDGYMLEVEGNCMNKVYPEGCFVLIDPNKQPSNGSIAVVKINEDEYVMRRMYKGANTLILSPESFDDSYKDIVYSSDEACVELVGTVVWFQSKEEMR